jgi:hypothetical protein
MNGVLWERAPFTSAHGGTKRGEHIKQPSIVDKGRHTAPFTFAHGGTKELRDEHIKQPRTMDKGRHTAPFTSAHGGTKELRDEHIKQQRIVTKGDTRRDKVGAARLSSLVHALFSCLVK